MYVITFEITLNAVFTELKTIVEIKKYWCLLTRKEDWRFKVNIKWNNKTNQDIEVKIVYIFGYHIYEVNIDDCV